MREDAPAIPAVSLALRVAKAGPVDGVPERASSVYALEQRHMLAACADAAARVAARHWAGARPAARERMAAVASAASAEAVHMVVERMSAQLMAALVVTTAALDLAVEATGRDRTAIVEELEKGLT